ncbi:SDR family NAD(P)-dependent oxidoreductase [Alteribacillus sp. YIM 98480]|uniref:SDR family NAD(P)-dependent oxidoreductase n=1 Tax=Alteribacillus sp. YIM 98480 TaxID=2606599 RepID=UPI0018EEF120|nr:SDR family NAD(P)-dependent oxidoreductase [Alteribacillus sp. YIM 98480]
MGALSGKTAIITGGARGLGRVYAHHLADLGAKIGIIDIDLHSYKKYQGEASLLKEDTVVKELESKGTKAAGVQTDIGIQTNVEEAVSTIHDELGNVDILVANAGGGAGKMNENQASNLNVDQYNEVMNRNLNGTIYSVNAVAPMMKKRRCGKIVTISSIAALFPFAEGTYAHYGTAKGAIMTYTKYLAQELGPYNINANCMAVGRIATGRSLELMENKVDNNLIEPIALGRLGKPEECAGVIEFLTTNLSDYVTGAVIEVTGGFVGFS